MDAEHLHNILLHTFSTNADARKAAEEVIANLHKVRGSILLLIQVITEKNVGREIRQAAAVSLKNLVQKYWEGEEGADGQWYDTIPEEEKKENRRYLLEALLMTDDNSLRSLLAETVNSIARLDFPERWPTLLEDICSNLQSGNATRICNALLVLRKLVKNYEYRQDDRKQPLFAIVEVTFPMLRDMLTQLQSNNSEESARMMHLILKIYWSSVQCALPPYAATVKEVSAWMELIRAIIAKPLPEASEGAEPVGQPTDEEERAAWPWWKIKKWALQILCRFYTRWGNPKKVEDQYAEMSAFFRNQVAPNLLTCVLETLALRKNGRFCTDRVVQLSLVFLQEAVDSSVAYKLLKPHLEFLLFDVIHPVLCLSQKDLMLWQEDPHEFVRKTNDVFEDFLDPVYAASNLLADLCTKRGKDCLQQVLVFYNGILTKYLAQSPEERDYIQKDAALHALFSLDGILTKSKAHKNQVEAMIINHILPEFENPNGFLRLRACRLFSRKYIEGINFQHEETLRTIVNGMLKCMFDPELPVRIEAAKTIRFVVMYPHSDVVIEVLRPMLPQILEQFFKLMDEIGNDEVVMALEHIIDRFADEIGPFSLQLIAKLVECFDQFTKAATDDDEDACLAAVSCLDAINTILISIHNHPELYDLLLPTLLPILQRVLTDYDYIEYMESALDIIGNMVYYSNAISPSLWSLFPLLFSCFHDYAADYITNLVPVIDNYIGRDIEGFIKGFIVTAEGTQLRYLEMVFNMVKQIFGNTPTEEIDLIGGCRLLFSLLHNCFGQIDDCLPAIVHLVCVKLSAEDLNEVATTHLLCVIGSCFHYNAMITLSSMEKLSATALVFKVWVGDLSRFKSFLDRKVFVLGIMSLLKIPYDQIPQGLQAHMKQLVQASTKVLGKMVFDQDTQATEGVDEEVEDEEDLEALLDQGGYGSDEDAEDVPDEKYLALLKELREESAFDTNYMYDEDNGEDYSSMLDEVDEVGFFLETLQGFSQRHAPEYNQFQFDQDMEMSKALELLTQEHHRRVQKRAAEQQQQQQQQ